MVAGATSGSEGDFRPRPRPPRSRADLAHGYRRDRHRSVECGLSQGARHERRRAARLHDRRVRDRRRDPRPPLPDGPARRRAAVGGRSDLLPARLRGTRLVGPAVPGLPACRGTDGRGRGRQRPAGPGTAVDERRHDRGDGRGRGVHRQRSAPNGRPGPPASPGPRDRLRPDARGAGPVVAPRLSPVEPRVLPAGPRPGRSTRPTLGLARSSGRGDRRADRAVLDPLRAALPLAAAAARGRQLDRRRPVPSSSSPSCSSPVARRPAR